MLFCEYILVHTWPKNSQQSFEGLLLQPFVLTGKEKYSVKKPSEASSTRCGTALPSAVIFDMDGVIFDTEHVALGLWKQVAEELRLSGMETVYPSCIGTTSVLSREILLNAYGPDFAYEAFPRRVRQLYEETYTREGLPVKPGVHELLSALSSSGVALALASSTRTETVRRELRDAGFLDFFDVVLGGDTITCSKPHPEIFLRAAELLNAPPADCFVIEDSFNGIRAAAAAGMHPLMVPDMLQPTEEILSLAERIFSSLNEGGCGARCRNRQSIDKVDALPSKVSKQTFDGNINFL
mgnify:CR=1 FL=1